MLLTVCLYFVLSFAVLITLVFCLNSWQRRPPIASQMARAVISAYLQNGKLIYEHVAETHKGYRTWRTVLLPSTFIFTADPANVEHVLKTNSANYSKGMYVNDRFKDIIGKGIIYVDGEPWRQQRKVAVREIAAPVMKQHSALRPFREAAVNLSRVLLKAYASDRPVDMQQLLKYSTMESFAKIAYGIDIKATSDANPGLQEAFAEAYETVSSAIFWRHIDCFWKLKRFLNIGQEGRVKKARQILRDYALKIIECSMSQNPDEKENFLSCFLDLAKEDPENFPQEYLQDIVLTFILAGRDTTAIALCWFFHLICKHPTAEQKIFDEIERIINPSRGGSLMDSIETFSEKLTHSTLDKMHYTHASLSETMRLYAPLPLLPKDVLYDDVLPDGSRVCRGDVIMIPPVAMGRMPYLWGDDADEFKPERWLNEKGCYEPQSPFKFTAFQGGPRACIGKDFSYLQMKLLVSVLIYFFKFEVAGDSDVSYRASISLDMDGKALQLYAKPRENY
eukprot:TRINITY_DN1794_c0_g1_i3.p1 TRINITY_DN1794_c0_g1~~TRINITY_DN1794_c0_g1_i3.p1  ORF type:complete len:507 (-),score=34.48 TRINITY_DN1794_c0_g1_i3:165-1685(-)